DNPDIRVAETKVREAEAELNRTRLLVTQKVVSLYHAIESQKALIQIAETDLAQAHRKVRTGVEHPDIVLKPQQALAIAKAKLAELEAEIPYLLGKPSQAAWKTQITDLERYF